MLVSILHTGIKAVCKRKLIIFFRKIGFIYVIITPLKFYFPEPVEPIQNVVNGLIYWDTLNIGLFGLSCTQNGVGKQA